MAKYISHNFFCIQCGKAVYPIMRKEGKMKEKFHRKRLYCPYCKQEINCIEVRNDIEELEFKEAYEKGEYREEAEESIKFVNKE